MKLAEGCGRGTGWEIGRWTCSKYIVLINKITN